MPSSKGAKKATFYAVRKGRIPGIYTTWEECQEQTHGVSGSIHAKFSSAAEAEDFIYGKGSSKDITSARATTQRSYTSANAPKEMDKKQVNISDIEDESSWDVVYTDGACKGNGKVGCIAGIGVWWGPNDPRNIAERCPGDQTNNRAELVAIVRALETTPISKRPLLIKSDSKYSINCFGVWLKNWEKNNFRTSTGLDVKNRNIILYLSALLRLRGRSGQKPQGDEGNDGADMLANQGTILPEEKDRDWAKLLRDLEKDTDNKLGEDNIIRL
ncbi:ribonuclease H-like domain-containing protein [Cyathus striatus]|nr:ribonuclease H-like domain-containing protein [Cyathus striatus]